MGHSGIWILSWGSRTITNKVARVLSLFVTTEDESDNRSIIIAGLVLVDASCMYDGAAGSPCHLLLLYS